MSLDDMFTQGEPPSRRGRLTQEEWEALVDEPVSPEREAAAKQFEEALMNHPDLQPSERETRSIDIENRGILTNEEADAVLEESRTDQKIDLPGYVHYTPANSDAARKLKELNDDIEQRRSSTLDELFGTLGEEE